MLKKTFQNKEKMLRRKARERRERDEERGRKGDKINKQLFEDYFKL